jgi:2-polyprenyl-3-methyl-5-hydroxy-6-metoxy-1,4-benzoquinol methylase
MSGMRQTLQPAFFEAMYVSDPDPWKFASSPYEQEKYAMTLNALPKRRYRSALEVGCSIGVLTRELALRSDALLAVDAAQTPVAAARRRCADLTTVRFEQMFVPERWPVGVFDLILLSEIVYYMDRGDVARLALDTARTLDPKGEIVLVHWTGATDYPLSGDQAAELFISFVSPIVEVVRQDRHDFFRLDVLSRR